MQIIRYNSIKWAFNIHATCEVCCFRSFSRIIFMQTARDCNLLWNGLSAGKHWLWWWCDGGGGGIFQKQKRKILKWKANPIISIKRTVLSSRHEWSQLAVVRALSKVLIVDDDGQKNKQRKNNGLKFAAKISQLRTINHIVLNSVFVSSSIVLARTQTKKKLKKNE